MKEACLNSNLAGHVCSKGLQAVPPRLGLSFEDAGKLLDLSSVIPGDNGNGNFDELNESMPGRGVPGFISMKQVQVDGLLQLVVGGQAILKVSCVQLLWWW